MEFMSLYRRPGPGRNDCVKPGKEDNGMESLWEQTWDGKRIDNPITGKLKKPG